MPLKEKKKWKLQKKNMEQNTFGMALFFLGQNRIKVHIVTEWHYLENTLL
jgi:hypothetical protein